MSMTTPGPTPKPPTPVPPPTTPGQVAAWTLYQEQLKEFQNPRPVPPVPVPPLAPLPVASVHPSWVNNCEECGAAVQAPCVGPSGQSLAYIHAPRLMKGAPQTMFGKATVQPADQPVFPNTLKKDGV
jgi:hypothetical protein